MDCISEIKTFRWIKSGTLSIDVAMSMRDIVHIYSFTVLVLFFFFFVCAVGTLSISNRRRLPSLAGPTHPQPDGHYLLDSLEASQSRAPTIRYRGFMLLREAELSGTGVPGWYN